MAVKITFTGVHIVEQEIGGPGEMLDAEVKFVATFPDGQSFEGAARIKQTVGSRYADKVIEVFPPTGLPQGREIPWDQFSSAATRFFTEKIVKKN